MRLFLLFLLSFFLSVTDFATSLPVPNPGQSFSSLLESKPPPPEKTFLQKLNPFHKTPEVAPTKSFLQCLNPFGCKASTPEKTLLQKLNPWYKEPEPPKKTWADRFSFSSNGSGDKKKATPSPSSTPWSFKLPFTGDGDKKKPASSSAPKPTNTKKPKPLIPTPKPAIATKLPLIGNTKKIVPSPSAKLPTTEAQSHFAGDDNKLVTPQEFKSSSPPRPSPKPAPMPPTVPEINNREVVPVAPAVAPTQSTYNFNLHLHAGKKMMVKRGLKERMATGTGLDGILCGREVGTVNATGVSYPHVDKFAKREIVLETQSTPTVDEVHENALPRYSSVEAMSDDDIPTPTQLLLEGAVIPRDVDEEEYWITDI